MPAQRSDTAMGADTEVLRGLGAASQAVPPVLTSAPVAPPVADDRRRRRMLIVAGAVTLALAGGGTAVALVQRADAAAAAEAAHEVVLATQATAFTDEQHALRTQNSVAMWRQTLADRAAAVVTATATLEAARATLAATPQAGDVARNTLQAAIDEAAAVVGATPSPSLIVLAAAMDKVTAPSQDAIAAQAAWQAAEDARVAAAAAAQAQAAADADAAASAAKASRSTRSSRSSSQAPRAAAPPAADAPEPAAGAPEFSAGALGGAINAWRADQGLPALSVSRSSGLYAHASEMAQASDIWHGGSDKIVGYAQPASAGALVQAWANSPGHRAWMANASVSSMQVGAAVLNNTLYAAVNFS